MSEQQPYRHIMGTEMEFPVWVKLEGEDPRQMDGVGKMSNVSELITKYLQPDIARFCTTKTSSNYWLGNGARLYTEQYNPEYASAECDDPADALLSELAGERIVSEALRRFVKRNQHVEWAMLLKRVIDDNRDTRGWHLNLSAVHSVFVKKSTTTHGDWVMNPEPMRPLAMHYATSRHMLGSGVVLVDQGSSDESPIYRYSHSQKVVTVKEDFNSYTLSNKPIINLRYEPLAATPDEHVRIHHVSEDPHMSYWAYKMALGSYTMLLAAIQQGRATQIEPAGKWVSAASIAHDATYDLKSQNLYEVRVNGDEDTKMYTVHDIQDIYINNADTISDKMPWMEETIEQWRRFAEDYKKDPALPYDRSDSIAKLRRIRQHELQHERGLLKGKANPALVDKRLSVVARIDQSNARDDIRDIMARMPAGKLRSTWFAGSAPKSDRMDDAVKNPSTTTTRAYKRGKLIQEQEVGRVLSSVDWNHVSLAPVIGNTMNRRLSLDLYDAEYPIDDDV